MRVALPLVLILSAAFVRAADPFTVTARLARVDAAWQVVVNVEVPPHHVLYAGDRFAVRIDGRILPGQIAPVPINQPDPVGMPESVFTSRVTAVYPLAAVNGTVAVRIKCQGCSDTSCFPPRTTEFALTTGGAQEVTAPATNNMTGGWLTNARIAGTAAGDLGSREFLDFLDRARGATSTTPRSWFRQFIDDPMAFLAQRGIVWTLLLMLLGGLLLNLTPCVLPMIPINLAIIGAGVRAGSRRRGAALGAAYGAGIALVYGALGVAVVLTGSVFGAIQSSPVFNGAMAAIFLALALAMFDVIPLDLSRFQSGGGSPRGGFIAAVVAGGISALLAGACVAPVVAAVLLLSSRLYHGGAMAAVLLPFMLGLGMASPWPFAGAGMAVLPKPGVWMVWVKYGFGILIAVMALYYGWLAYGGVSSRTPATSRENELVAGDAAGWEKWLAAARTGHKPLMLDFHASWCKSCQVMDHTTFRDPAVRRALEQFIVVRVATEHPDEAPAIGMVKAFDVAGLPTYVVVEAY